MLKSFLLTSFLCLFGSASFVHAHHCGPTQPLPEFPRHSCRTHTQTWQPGETIDQHPGGAKGRGPGAPQQTERSCIYYVDPSRINEMLRTRPGVCQRYGPDRIICDADTSQSNAGGGSASQSETWGAKLKRELESEIESQATRADFDHKRTTLTVTILASGGWRRAAISGVFSDDYLKLADQVVNQFMNDGRTRPPDRKSHKITLVLTGTQPASTLPANSQSDGAACPYVPGQILQGKAEEKTTVDNRPTITSGTDYPAYPPPQTQQPPTIQVVYGRIWWKPGGQNLYFPIDIQVPNSVPLNLDQTAPLSGGPAGQYYAGFSGHLMTKWNPQTGYGGSFRIMQLQLVGGG